MGELTSLNYTLMCDGSSDANALMRIIDWLVTDIGVTIPVEGKWADLRILFSRRKRRSDKGLTLMRRIPATLELFPGDVLFIHRDAERETLESRKQEIIEAASTVSAKPPFVCIIPVRMHEAWLLFDEAAIRLAAGNPSGKMPLDLPSLQKTESCSSPKSILEKAIETASGRNKRRLVKLNVSSCKARVADLIDDFSPLRHLPAFRAFEEDLREVLIEFGVFPRE